MCLLSTQMNPKANFKKQDATDFLHQERTSKGVVKGGGFGNSGPTLGLPSCARPSFPEQPHSQTLHLHIILTHNPILTNEPIDSKAYTLCHAMQVSSIPCICWIDTLRSFIHLRNRALICWIDIRRYFIHLNNSCFKRWVKRWGCGDIVWMWGQTWLPLVSS